MTKAQRRQIARLSRLFADMQRSGALDELALRVDTGGSISDVKEAADTISREKET